MKTNEKIPLIYNLLEDENVKEKLINALKENIDEKGLIRWTEDNIPLLPYNEKCVEIYSIVLNRSKEEIKSKMIHFLEKTVTKVNENQNINSFIYKVSQNTSFGVTTENQIISDGVAHIIKTNDIYILDFEGTASYIVEQWFQADKLIKKTANYASKMREIPLFTNTYSYENIDIDDIDYTRKANQKILRKKLNERSGKL